MIKDNNKVNELVLLKNENLPPQKWTLGRIIEQYFSEDKWLRMTKVNTQSKVHK